MRRSRSGVALVLFSGLLALLLLIGTTFLRVSGQARAVGGSGVDRARAGVLGRSGVEYALARMAAEPFARPHPARASDDWTCRETGAWRPIDRVANPSYNMSHPGGRGERYVAGTDDGWYDSAQDGFPPAADRNGNRAYDGFSGRLRGAHGPYAETFSLRIVSEQGKLHVNGGTLGAGDGNAVDPPNGIPDHRDRNAGYNATLRRVLNLLGGNAAVGVPGLGDLTIDNRPPGGYLSLDDLPVPDAQRERLSAFLTCHAWVDRSVIRPNGAAAGAGERQGLADFVVERGGAPRIDPDGRAPVDPNAAPRPVLEALLSGLSGVYRGGLTTGIQQYTAGISPGIAATVASRIEGARAGREDANGNGVLDPGEDADGDGTLDSPFLTWTQFALFCDRLASAGTFPQPSVPVVEIAVRAYPDLLVANFCPSSDLNKSNPDAVLHRHVDKSDLTVHSTEFILGLPPAFVSVESLGQVRDAGGRILAAARPRAVVERAALVRQTTQRDFVGGRAMADRYISPAQGAGFPPETRTSGAARGAPGIGWSLATYPEPPTRLPAGAADWDGQIGLAATELPAAAPIGTTFLHHFDDAWDAEVGGGPDDSLAIRDHYGVRVDDRLQADPAASVQDPSRPGGFVADGAHIQGRRTPVYASLGNLPPQEGTASYWIKPGLQPVAYRGDLTVACVPPQFDSFTQYFFVGNDNYRYGWILEDAENVSDGRHELINSRDWWERDVPARQRWLLVTASWDLDDTATNRWMSVRGRFGPGVIQNDPLYTQPFAGTPMPLPSDTRRLVLGGARPIEVFKAYTASQTLDELVIYDPGSSPAAAFDRARIYDDDRYAAGRYYKGNDGRFVSTDLAPSIPPWAGALEALAWTEWLPGVPTTYPRVTFPNPFLPPVVSWLLIPPDPDLVGARLGVEILEGADGSETVLHDTERFPPRDYRRAGRVRGAAPRSPLRYRVTFRPTPDWDADRLLNTPLLETPFLDDVTISFRSRGAPRMRSWKE